MRSDSELLASYARTGDEAAFAEVVARHGAMVYRACLRLLADAHEAEDATQAVFVVLARRAKEFRPGADLAGWLHGIARHAADEARRARRRRLRHEKEAAMIRPAQQAGASGAAGGAAILDRLDREVAALPAAQRQAVLLRYLEGRSLEESAAVAEVPAGTLGRRAAEGLARLRERLSRGSPALGAEALVELLAAEAGATAPAAVLSSLLAAPKLAAAAAAAGVVGAKAAALAEGVMKAIFWIKVKLAAAVLVGAAVVGGGGTAIIIAAGEPAVPKAEGRKPIVESAVSEKGIECRVTELVAGGQVKLSAGSAQGVREKFEFDVSRDGKPVGMVRVTAVEEKQATAEIASVTGEIKVGDTARTRFGTVLAAPAAEGLALTLTVEPSIWKAPHTELVVSLKVINKGKDAVRLVPFGPGQVEVRDAAGRPVAMPYGGSDRSRMLNASDFPEVQPGAAQTFSFSGSFGRDRVLSFSGPTGGWWASQAPLADGRYTLRAVYANQEARNKIGGQELSCWTGQVTSNEVVVTVGDASPIAWGEAVNGLQAGLIPLGGGEPSTAFVVISSLARHLQAGKSVVASLGEIGKDNPGRVAEAVKFMDREIRSGRSLAEVMAVQPEFFDAASVEAVRKGEEARTVDLALAKLAEKLAAAGADGASVKNWPDSWTCLSPACGIDRKVTPGAGKCQACADPTGSSSRQYCTSCAAAKRVCAFCGAAKPWGAMFVEDETLTFELHLRNVGEAALSLERIYYNHPCELVFTPGGGGAPLRAAYTGPVPSIKLSPSPLDKDRQVAFIVGPSREELARGFWRFDTAAPGRRAAAAEPLKALPAGKYTVTASYEHAAGHKTVEPCPYWHGKVTTGAVEIEVKPKAAAQVKPATEKPTASQAGNLITIQPMGLSFRIPDSWVDWQKKFKNNVHLTAAQLAATKDGGGEWDTEFAEVVNAVLPFERCVAATGAEGWGKNGVSFADVQMRVYVLDEEPRALQGRLTSDVPPAVRGLFTPRKVHKRELAGEIVHPPPLPANPDQPPAAMEVPLAEDEVGGWRRSALSYNLHYGDYGGVAKIAICQREFGGRTVAAVFMYAGGTPDQKKTIEAILGSFSLAKQQPK